ncbi:hypothetical protein DBV05_g6559 [Lasiodiplodia theobromae]|uniref:Uncharacterized protein n=1 Tax=Lasiodiplodia theobromae TaxID=45133 RepID=A0A5N5DAK6_9PEZI|nr:hypothetical protein DBV05_g6559 [Lasiodiplodia theobromae]
MLHPTTSTTIISRRALLSAAAKPYSTTTTTMPYRLRATCPRATRIATIRASTASTAAMNSSTTSASSTTTSTTTTSTSTRSLHFSRTLLGSTKEDHMERDRLNPTSTEYSKTGSDDAAAHMDDAAFNPNKTRPEEEVGSAERESGEVRRHQQKQQQSSSSQGPNPLNVSPGNRDVSATKDPKQSGPDRSPSESGEASSRARTSSRGSPAKHGGGKTGGGGVH